MPWDDDEPSAPGTGAPKKMPWDDDEPAAGPTDDDDLPGAKAPAGKSPFDDDEPAAPLGKTRFDDDGGSISASLDESRAKPGKAAGGEDDFLNSLGGASLDGPKDAQGAKKKKLLILGGALAVVALAIAALFVFKPWTKMNIPFLGSLAGEQAKVEPADKVKDIALRNVRQYYIPNEKAGNVFVVEGKAVNNFATPKERIKVEITLFDEKGKVLVSKQLLCGNTLSQFQLQVQSEEEINASLASEVGILTSNTYLKTGMDTPFMAVFFKPPDAVKEFGVKVIDVQDPK
jgi:intracellular sulfur oxidation DsrE/DsrF family protein